MQKQQQPSTRSTKRCLKCRKRLSPGDPAVYGPICAQRVTAAVRVLEVSTSPVERRAAALLRAGGLYPAPIRDRWIGRGSNSSGNSFYLTGPDFCTCKAAEYDKMCYHRVAAIILSGKLPQTQQQEGRESHE